MTRPITPADTARAMHAAEMRGQDMQDAPEQIWAVRHGWEVTLSGNVQIGQWAETAGQHGGIPYTRSDLCITEAECQRRSDAAVLAEREACAAVADEESGWPENTESVPTDLTNEGRNAASKEIAAAIRARGQK